jgi:invasion protein IalB
MSGSRHVEPRRGNNHAIAALLTAAIFGVASSQPAASQPNSTAALKSAGTEIAPHGQRETKEIAYGDWKKLCFKPGGEKMVCRTSIAGTFATGQRAIRLDIIEREGHGAPRLQLFAPVGMYLQKPVKLAVDQGKPHLVPYTWCLTNTCIAGAAASPKMIQEMSSGQTLQLEFIDPNFLSLTTKLPLGQFTAIHKGAPAQIFEQDIDE